MRIAIRDTRELPKRWSEEVKTIHDELEVADAGLKEHLNYDWYDRYSLVDHFISRDVSINDFNGVDFSTWDTISVGNLAYMAIHHSKENVRIKAIETLLEFKKY